MTDRPQDAELAAHFAAQRRAEAEGVPPFAPMLARARAQADADAVVPGRRRLFYAGGLAAAAAIALVLVVPRAGSNEDAFEQAVREFQRSPALGAWQSPTDALLDVPGTRLMTTVPSVGTP